MSLHLTDEPLNKDSAENDVIKLLTEKVNQLYLYRDNYFEKNSSEEDACNKNKNVEEELRKTLSNFEQFKDAGQQKNRAYFFYLKGKALNVKSNHDSKAEEALSKAVKFDPKLVDAWNELGECYWKKDDIIGAKNCFINALAHQKNKVSLRNLSMVLRQIPTKTLAERISNIEESLLKAKEAVQLDPNDGISWTILGNAHLSSFFTISYNPKTLKLSLSSYIQAEKDACARTKPDLYYNKAMALKYEEEYQQALESFSKAISLDPIWDTARHKEEELCNYLSNVQELISCKGKLKGKKLQNLIQAIDEKHLGPYHCGTFLSTGNQKVKIDHVPLSELNPGVNPGKVILGKVVCSVLSEDEIPFTFCLVDKMESCIAVTLYNLGKGQGVLIGDSVAIPEPFLTRVHVKHKGKEYCFDSIRVERPVFMVVNGKNVSRDKEATVQHTYFKKD
ncbi:tetratricopeptide repeat protein 5-like [Ischnura elegans]|uniref:tetratricopeptide repeat protein 5-like n=1 Tax=Ischnura elegans TaxID=197161 RepID=UPI001ED879C4|nr:tetratricopeptide repeat protein 5-like [Ischnura elegans]